ncbi:MAG: hypothetical protein WC222_08690 [Parachlamydiales bacterium]|jgi:hypothetical protein
MSNLIRVPEEAGLLKNLYESTRYYSENKDTLNVFKGYFLPRFIYTPLTVPAALARAVSFEGQAFLKAGAKALELDVYGVFYEFLSNTASALKCTALAVAGIADTFFGILIGNHLYKLALDSPFNPPQEPPAIDREEHSRIVADAVALKSQLSAITELLHANSQTDYLILEELCVQIEALKSNITALENEAKAFESAKTDLQEILNMQAPESKFEGEIQELKKRIVALQIEKESLEKTAQNYLDTNNELNRILEKSSIASNASPLTSPATMDQGIQVGPFPDQNVLEDIQLLQNKIKELELQKGVLEKQVEIYVEANAELQATLSSYLVEEKRKLDSPPSSLNSSGSGIPTGDEFSNTTTITTSSSNSDLSSGDELPVTSTSVITNSTSGTEIPGTLVDNNTVMQLALREDIGIEADFHLVGSQSTTLTAPEATDYTNLLPTPVKNFFTEINPEWKKQRYDTTFEQLIRRFGETRLKELQGKCKDKNPIQKNLKDAISLLLTYRNADDAHLHYQTFQVALRTVLRDIHSTENKLKNTFKTEILSLCKIWFTELEMDTFYTGLVHQVANEGNKELVGDLKECTSLATRLKLLMKGIVNARQISGFDNMKAQVGTVWATFDPLWLSNVPNQLATYIYKNPETQEEKKITQVRTGVPIGPRQAPTPTDAPWVYEGIELVPEYMAYLNQLKAEGKKLLVILHLNPKYAFENPGVFDYCNFTKWQPQREGLWVRLYMQLAKSEEYKDVIDLSLLPMDGEWMKEIEKNEVMKKSDFLNWFKHEVISNPAFMLGYEGDEKALFVQRTFEEVKKAYFPTELDAQGREIEMMFDKKKRLAFVGMFYSRISEELALCRNSDVVQRNCKDAIDRTMSIFAADICDKLSRTKEFVADKYEKLSGIILGPALTVLKRELLFHRAHLMFASVKHLEAKRETPVNYSERKGFVFERVEFAQ